MKFFSRAFMLAPALLVIAGMAHSAVAITAGASASAGTSGASAGASGGEKNARATGVYEKGMAVFTIAKGGLMYAANIAGQHFSFTPRHAK
jgi:hypothetical protein